MIKAIETRYKGYRFRSRLEARWAVFFDALGVPWHYEAEGYDLGKLGWYLPDFWLPDHGVFVEVKGAAPFQRNEVEKCRALSGGLDKAVWLVSGLPVERDDNLIFAGDLCDSSAGCWECEGNMSFFPQGHTAISCNDRRVERDRVIFLEPGSFGRDVLAAYPCKTWVCEAARSARFEHGETPT